MNDVLTHQSLCEGIVDQSSVAIVFGDREGIIRLWNAGAETMFGWNAGEAIGKSMDMIIPEKHRPRHWEGYDRVMETGITKYGQSVLAVPASTKDGRQNLHRVQRRAAQRCRRAGPWCGGYHAGCHRALGAG